MKTLIIRSLEDAQDTATMLEKKGVKTETLPIFSVEYDNINIDSLNNMETKNINGVIVTSVKTVQALENTSKKFKKLQIFSVGDKTTERLKAAGFKKIKTGPGTALELEAMIQKTYKNKKNVSLYYVSGEAVSYNFDILESSNIFTLTRTIVYKTLYIDELPNNIVNALKTGEIAKVVVLSQGIAEKFVELVHTAGLSETCSSIKAYTLTNSIKSTLEQIPFSAVKVPKKPKLPLLVKEIMKRKSYKNRFIALVIVLIILCIVGAFGYYKFMPNEKSMVSNFVNMIVPQDIFNRNKTDKKHKHDDKNSDKDDVIKNDVVKLSNDSANDDNVDDVINSDNVSDDTQSNNDLSNDNLTATDILNNQDDISHQDSISNQDDISHQDDTSNQDDINHQDIISNQDDTNNQDNISHQDNTSTDSQERIKGLESELLLLKSQLKENKEALSEINKQVVSNTNGRTNSGENDIYTSYALLLMIRQDVLSGRTPINSVNIFKEFIEGMEIDKVTHAKITSALNNLAKINGESPQLPKLGATIFDLSYNGVVDYNYKQTGTMGNVKHYLYKIIKVRYKTHKVNSAEDIIDKIKKDCLNNNYQDIERLFNLLPAEVKMSLQEWHKQALIAIGNLQDIDYLQATFSQKLNGQSS